MSNEDIVSLIQAGNADCFADLWAQLERLVRWKAKRIISATGSRGGFDFDDLCQSGYLAMVAAVNTYTPGAGSFTGLFMLHLRTAFAEAMGLRSQKQAKDPIHSAFSMDYSLTDDSDADLLHEVIPDPNGEQAFASVDDRLWHEQLSNALARAFESLDAIQQEVLQRRYYQNQTLTETAKQMEISPEAVRKNERKGLQRLRGPDNIARLRPFFEFDYYAGAGLCAFRSSGMSIQERYLVLEEKQENVGKCNKPNKS